MEPYEALYERPCRSLIYWTEVGEISAIGPDFVKDTSEKVDLIRKRLKVMPKRGVVRFDKLGKLLPRYIGPFEVIERVGTVVYQLALPPRLSGVHVVFHVSMLRKYTPDPTHVVD